jgi:thymidylate kinase
LVDFSRRKDVFFADDMLVESADRSLFMSAYSRLYAGHRAADVVIYLKATPELCLERARKRWERDPSRDFERGMTVERLARLKSLYERRVAELGDEVLVLDLDEVIDEDLDDSQSMGRVADAIVELLKERVGVIAPR